IQWPCYTEDSDDKGTQYLHDGAQFATADGKGRFYYFPWIPVKEVESPDYPLSLSTVREVGHYSVRTMTGNCRLLVDLADEPGFIQMNPDDCQNLNIADGDLVRVISRRGQTVTRCQVSDRVSQGSTYMTYQWWIGACNELTISALDPKSSTPEYKYCACRVEKIDDQKQAEMNVKAQYAAIRSRMGIQPEGGLGQV
ncbi:MAG: molybdopterin oxidoreductase family protein, partial [Megasphaera sp.]